MSKLFKCPIFTILFLFLLLSGFCRLSATEADTSRNGAIKVFFDCRSCDMNYTRQEIPYVNYVRDVKEAQVYILVTDQDAGSGGDQFTYSFQGIGEFKGMNDTLVFTSSPDQTSAVIRQKRTQMLKMALMRYVVRTPLINEIDVVHNEGFETAEVIDKWNNWVFEIRTSPRFNAEESYRNLNLSNSFTISKITPDIKFDLDFDQSFNRQQFIEDDDYETFTRSSESVNLLFVKSLGDHWSAGIRWDLRSSTQSNYDLRHTFEPAIEYDIFPYSEATHKQLRFLYSVGYEYSNYIDTSIFNIMEEHRLSQEISVAYQVQEKWGSINLSLYGSNYFHDFSKNTLAVDGFIRIRLIKGLSFSINGEARYINNRLNQRKGDLSEAERLLRLKQQATSFEIGGSLSINYTFGSIYNNAVNPRFSRY